MTQPSVLQTVEEIAEQIIRSTKDSCYQCDVWGDNDPSGLCSNCRNRIVLIADALRVVEGRGAEAAEQVVAALRDLPAKWIDQATAVRDIGTDGSKEARRAWSNAAIKCAEELSALLKTQTTTNETKP